MSLRDMTPIIKASQELADTLDEDLRRGMIEMLALVYKAKVANGKAATEYKAYTELLKRWLEAHEGEVLYDGEREITAQLKQKKVAGGPDVDLISLRQKDPALFERLWATGCLQANVKALEAQGGQVSGWKAYAMERGVQYTFDIQKKGEE